MHFRKDWPLLAMGNWQKNFPFRFSQSLIFLITEAQRGEGIFNLSYKNIGFLCEISGIFWIFRNLVGGGYVALANILVVTIWINMDDVHLRHFEDFIYFACRIILLFNLYERPFDTLVKTEFSRWLYYYWN